MKRIVADIKTFEFRSTVTLLTAAFVLVTLQFRGKAAYWQNVAWLRERWPGRAELDFATQVAWAATTVFLFGVVPFLVATLIMRMKPSEFGFNARGFLKHSAVYLGFFVLMSPLIYWASKRPDFIHTYPFPALARTDDGYFWRWEVAYFLQFCALEMFFRGFMLFGLERKFGQAGILVMVIPYAMIHFSKPMPEAFGAIFAGLALGYMALRTRSFYGGILLHYAVALTMDCLARSRLPEFP